MGLLDEELPLLTLRPDVAPGEFFDRCEEIAHEEGYPIDRRREYAGLGYDQLNLHLDPVDDYPMLRMVLTASSPTRLAADVVARWTSHPPTYEEYLSVAKSAYRELLSKYATRFGRRLRIGIPRRPTVFDPAKVDCNRIDYALSNLDQAVQAMAVGPGDVRQRLTSAFWTFHVVRPEDLPPPLDEHMQWVYDQLTHRPARYRGEGTVAATTAQMRRSTGVKIAERILAISDALREIHKKCQEDAERHDSLP